MVSGQNFWDTGVWSFIITMTILFVGMMVANILRRTIKPLKRSLIPSSVLGGFLVLLVDFIYRQITGESMFTTSVLETLTYHGLGLGFAAMSLRTLDKPREKGKQRDIFNTGVTVVSSYLIQGIVGIAASLGLYYIIGSYFASGMLLPMGFGQGPGQAYNWGHTYEMTYGFSNGTSFGLTVAAVGFIAASIGGVIYLNILRKKGKISGDMADTVSDKNLNAEMITGNGEIPLSESMDKLTVQVALVFIAYILAYLFMTGINCVIETGILGNFGYNTLQPLIWGFNFLFASVFGILVKTAMGGMKKAGIIKREYKNNFMQTRIAGFMFDIMVVASIAAIDLKAFTEKEFIVPLIIICVAGAAVTYFYVNFVCKKLFPGYEAQAFLALYGMLTGTASTGVILLRESDPVFETPAANNLVYQQLWAIVFGFPMLLLLGVAPKGTAQSWLSFGLMILMFIVMNVILFRASIFKKKKKADKTE